MTTAVRVNDMPDRRRGSESLARPAGPDTPAIFHHRLEIAKNQAGLGSYRVA
jgi:hypothetical protein